MSDELQFDTMRVRVTKIEDGRVTLEGALVLKDVPIFEFPPATMEVGNTYSIKIP